MTPVWMPSARLVLPLLMLFALPAVAGKGAVPLPPAAEDVRGLWVTRASMTSPAAVRAMVETAERGGFNTLIVQVRGRGDAYYRSSYEPRAPELASLPEFDPLALTVSLARAAGLTVHAWLAVNLVSSATDLSSSRQHIIHRQPDWLMVPRELAGELRALDPRSPRYVARLAAWTRARPQVEGLFASPVHPWAATHVVKVATEIVSRYAVDGLHLDYVRFPNDDFDYSRTALQQFKVAVRPQLTGAERRAADARDRHDPLAYPELFRERWTAFRRTRLTELVTRVRTAVKAARPDVVLSAAVFPDSTEAATVRLQDWRTWATLGLLDAVSPMAYTDDAALFERQVGEARSIAGAVPVWAGIGAYRLTADQTLAHIATARRAQAGILLFSYDSLVSPPGSAATLTHLGRVAFGREP